MRCSYEDILEYVNLGFVGVATLAVTQMAFTACALHRLPRIRDTRRMCYVSTARPLLVVAAQLSHLHQVARCSISLQLFNCLLCACNATDSRPVMK